MFIIKTQSSSKNATKYYTHRLVESKRDSMGKVGRCKSLTQVRGGITFSNIIRLSSTK